MKNSIFTILVLFAFSELFSQNNNQIKSSCVENGVNVSSKAVKVNVEHLLKKYSEVPIYKIYLKNDDEEAVEYGPAKADLMKVFGGKNGDKGFYCLKDLSGLNFAAVQAMYVTIIEQQKKIESMEETQELLSRQSADLAELQNQVLSLTSAIEELKQQYIDLKSNMNDLKVEMDTK